MAARAIWKGVVRFGREKLGVKLYSAVQDRTIRFRLLHETDLVPVRQRMVDPRSEEPVEKEEVRKALAVSRASFVVFDDEELEKLEPEDSRDIEVLRFVDSEEIDHRWYSRAYYLAPEGAAGSYFALAAALEQEGREGVAKWVMRKKEYVGSLRAVDGYLMLIVLRHADEVIAADQLDAPAGRELSRKEIAMAEQLISALEGSFDPSEYCDEYRERVMELIELKAKGKKPKVTKFKPRKTDEGSLAGALEASLKGAEKRRSAGGRGR